ncbi:hypothetical protein THAOC_01711, partial [Thalassiosira oceanica]
MPNTSREAAYNNARKKQARREVARERCKQTVSVRGGPALQVACFQDMPPSARVGCNFPGRSQRLDSLEPTSPTADLFLLSIEQNIETMTRFAQTAFLLLGLLQAKFASSIEVGDEVCLTGYIMDNFCVEN